MGGLQASDASIRLESLGTVAEVATLGARLLSLTVDGAALTQPVTASTPHTVYNGIVLAPWPNRVRNGRWVLDGEVQQLDITEPARGGALHGLLAFAYYEVLEQSDEAVTLSARIPMQHGWPFTIDTTVRYELHPEGITVTHTAHNRSSEPAPWAVGAHPYLRVGDHPVQSLTVTVPSSTVFVVDDRLDPVDEVPADGHPLDLREGRVVGDVKLDTAYRIDPPPPREDGLIVSAALEADDGNATLLLQSPGWDFVQVFTTLVYPGEHGLIGAVAVEPMTAPPDSLNSGIGLRWLDPGEHWTGSWALRRR